MTTKTVPKTLADLKRLLVKGAKIELVETGRGLLLADDRRAGVRTVETVQTNAITFKKEGERASWHYWAKASHYIFSEDGFILKDPDYPQWWLRYEYR